MKILVVSGFLGAGKTTFIRTLLKQTGIRAAVLENEYGETDLDGRTIGKDNPLQVLEFAEGCVCCTKKDSFANTIITISAGLDPEWLIVEPSGVGKLSAIKENIRRVSYEKIVPAGSVLVVAPRSFYTVMNDYPDIFEDQIAHANRVVLSKTESEDAAVIEDVVNEIRKRNPGAPILTDHYAKAEDAWWQGLLTMSETDAARDSTKGRGYPAASRSADALSQADTEGAPDVEQVTLHTATLNNAGELIVFLEDVLHGLFGNIVRAKGVLPCGKEVLRFDVADALYAITAEDDTRMKTECVFIGKGIKKNTIRDRLNAGTMPVRMRGRQANS